MTFLELKKRLARRTGKNATTLDAVTSTRLGDFLNEAHRTILRKPGMDSLRYGLVTFASVAGQQAYALPAEGIARANRVWDPLNTRKLDYRTLDWLRAVDPNPQQGTPWAWIPTGYVEVHTQPSNASSVFVDSTSASDTNTAYVEGITATGQYRSVSVAMTGVTAVNVSTAVSDWVHITKFYLSAAAVGSVTLHEDASGGTELSKITVGRARAQYYALLLQDIPSAVVTYSVDILRGIPDMANNTDEPLLPEDFHDLLVDGAQLRELTKGDDPRRWQAVKNSYDAGYRDLQHFITNHPDWRPTFGDGEGTGISTLGPWFPVDTVVG